MRLFLASDGGRHGMNVTEYLASLAGCPLSLLLAHLESERAREPTWLGRAFLQRCLDRL